MTKRKKKYVTIYLKSKWASSIQTLHYDTKEEREIAQFWIDNAKEVNAKYGTRYKITYIE